MTTPEEFVLDTGALFGILALFVLVVGGVAWLFERHTVRRHEPEILPPPVDGRDHNDESIAEYKRKRALVDRVT